MSTLSAINRSRQKVLGYPVDMVDEDEAVEIIETAWQCKRGLYVVTLNAEMIVTAQQDGDLDRIIRHAHLIIPDGAGVVWALKLAGYYINRLPGIELASILLDKAAETGRKVAFLGGRPEILEKIIAILPEKYPGLKIVASHHGYYTDKEEEQIVNKIAQCEPELLLIAQGVPKQEYFIDRFQSCFPRTVMIGVGGSFDVWAGSVKRAPLVMRKLHLEWLYRLLTEPWRWRRIGSSLPNFFLQVLQDAVTDFPKSRKK